MKNLEEKAAAAASLYVQQSLHKKAPVEECWTAKEDYSAGYLLGSISASLATEQRRAKALRLLAELIRIAEGRGDYHSSTAAKYIVEVLK